jgi:hypothetical protein
MAAHPLCDAVKQGAMKYQQGTARRFYSINVGCAVISKGHSFWGKRGDSTLTYR